MSIEEFLGENVLNTPQIQNSKLPLNIANSLEAPLSVDELDVSRKECKSNTAPGIDGISYAFIKKFWSILRIPLTNYANSCFEKQSLTTNFKTAAIKLIPKKGDPTQIKTGGLFPF